MLTNSNELAFFNLFLYLLVLSRQPALLDGGGGHGCGKLLEIEIRDIASVSLEVGVVSEKFIEFVAAGLSLEEDVFAVGFEGLLDLHSDGI